MDLKEAKQILNKNGYLLEDNIPLDFKDGQATVFFDKVDNDTDEKDFEELKNYSNEIGKTDNTNVSKSRKSKTDKLINLLKEFMDKVKTIVKENDIKVYFEPKQKDPYIRTDNQIPVEVCINDNYVFDIETENPDYDIDYCFDYIFKEEKEKFKCADIYLAGCYNPDPKKQEEILKIFRPNYIAEHPNAPAGVCVKAVHFETPEEIRKWIDTH